MTTLHGDWTGLLSFVSAVLLSTFFSSYLLPVSLSNFYLAVPMRRCLGKHSCMSSPFPIAILNGTCSLRAPMLFCGDVPAIKAKLNKQTISTSFTFSHTHASLLTFFCFFLLFHSCCSHAPVFLISYSHTEWYLLFWRAEIVLALAEASLIKI